MVQHQSLLSMPLTSQAQMSVDNTKIKSANIEDQEASFTFRFNSCSKCGYTEFYLVEKGQKV
jgi:predicted nucleic-acid-binding Zn-ribbon protein